MMNEDPRKRPTIYDVAKLAGVSHSTVSRVVRGESVVKKVTIDKVNEAIQRLGYRPDPALSALAAYRTRRLSKQSLRETLAFIDCDGSDYSRLVFDGCKLQATAFGYQLEKQTFGDQKREQRQLARTLYHRGIRGLIFGPSYTPRELVGWRWDKHAAVALGALIHQPRLNAVAPDYFLGAYTACRILQKRGCQRIGFVVEPSLEARTDHRWLGGYYAGIGESKSFKYRGPWPLGKEFRQWCRLEKVDGLISIHGDIRKHWEGNIENVLMISCPEVQPNENWPHYSLDPGLLGEEAIRVIHHSLLKQQFGVPSKPGIVMLTGTWTGAGVERDEEYCR